jgi:hypothetical protein
LFQGALLIVIPSVGFKDCISGGHFHFVSVLILDKIKECLSRWRGLFL